MKVALCFSGHVRDLDRTFRFWDDLVKKYNVDVYGSFWDSSSNIDTVDKFKAMYNPVACDVENYECFRSTTMSIAHAYVDPPNSLAPFFQQTTKAFGQLSMYYKIWKCNMLCGGNGMYDLVIRARTDTMLDSNLVIEKNECLNVPIGNVFCSAFSGSIGINDCFAYGKPSIMNYYSFLYLKVMEYLNAGHYAFPPEHFLAVHFSKVNVPIRYLPSYITITRTSRGTADEVYNKFVTNMNEYVVQSGDLGVGGDSTQTFVNSDFASQIKF